MSSFFLHDHVCTLTRIKSRLTETRYNVGATLAISGYGATDRHFLSARVSAVSDGTDRAVDLQAHYESLSIEIRSVSTVTFHGDLPFL